MTNSHDGGNGNRRPSSPSVRAFAQAEDVRPRVKPHLPKRPPEVIEALLEEVVAKVENTNRMLQQHIAHGIEDRKAVNLRLDGIQSLLGEIVSRLPSPSPSEAAPVIEVKSGEPSPT